MTILNNPEDFGDALSPAGERGLPIEAWTLDDFNMPAEFDGLRPASMRMDERGE